MNKQVYISLFFLTFGVINAQELTIIDELGSPIRDVYLVNNDANAFAFTNKSGRASIVSFSEKDHITISHSGYLTTTKTN